MNEQDLSPESIQDLKSRLDEIVDIVSDDSLDLDQALAYYEEAVKIGLRASEMLEKDVVQNNALYDEALKETQSLPNEETN